MLIAEYPIPYVPEYNAEYVLLACSHYERTNAALVNTPAVLPSPMCGYNARSDSS